MDIITWLKTNNIEFTPTKSGGELLIICPFHGGESPHLSINSISGKWQCFVCGQVGNKFEFLAESLGKKFDGEIIFDSTAIEEPLDAPPIDQEIIETHHQALLDGGSGTQDIRNYLYKRGLSDEIIKEFKLGWDGKNLVIPVFDYKGDCYNQRRKPDPSYNPHSPLLHLPGRGRTRLFNEKVLRKGPKGGHPERVFIMEGEWDVMRMAAFGQLAVTATNGANSFKPEFVDKFEYVDKIYICFDLDLNGVGQGAALKVAKMFDDRGTKTWFINLGQILHGKDKLDFSDWAKNKSHKDLTNLMTSAQEYTGENPLSKPAHIATIQEIRGATYPANKWLIEGIILDNAINLFSGAPGTMKSYVTNHIATCIWRQEPVFHHFPVNTPPIPILFVDKENTNNRIKSRFDLLGLPDESKIYYSQGNFLIVERGEKGGMDLILNTIQSNGIKLVIFDTLVRFHDGNENDAKDMNAIYNRLVEIRNFGVTILYLHHHNKAGGGEFGKNNPQQDTRGSSDIHAQVDTHFGFYRDHKDDPLKMVCGKSRDDALLNPFLVQPIFEEQSVDFRYLKEVEEEGLVANAVIEELILILFTDGVEIARQTIMKKIATESGKSTATVARSLKRLTDNRILTMRVAQDGKTYLYQKNIIDDFIKDN